MSDPDGDHDIPSGSLIKTALAPYARCMPITSSSLDQMVTALVSSLSRSLAEQFNVFRVMHHGTHETQLSNVFAWLLRADGTHGLGDDFQRIFVGCVNRGLPEVRPEVRWLPD